MASIGKWVKKWKVESNSSDRVYIVSLSDQGIYGCSCPAWKFRRQECSHIQFVRRENPEPDQAQAAKIEKPGAMPARVLTPEYDHEKNVILYPLIPIGPDNTNMEATICWFLSEHGYTWQEIKEMRRLSSQWTKRAVYSHIEYYGPAQYPEDFYDWKLGIA